MKTQKLVLGLAVMAIGFTSCKDEKAEQAKKKVDLEFDSEIQFEKLKEIFKGV